MTSSPIPSDWGTVCESVATLALGARLSIWVLLSRVTIITRSHTAPIRSATARPRPRRTWNLPFSWWSPRNTTSSWGLPAKMDHLYSEGVNFFFGISFDSGFFSGVAGGSAKPKNISVAPMVKTPETFLSNTQV